MELRFSAGVLVVLLSVALAACPEDSTSEPDASVNPYADVSITQTECDYNAECVGILGALDPCRVARCEEGTCVAALAPAGISCDSAQGLGECESGVCNQAGNCVGTVAPDGTACDTGNWDLCTSRTCMGGVCSDSPLVNCDDKNNCTEDACNPATGECEYSSVTAECDDNNPCTGNDQCTDGVCIGSENLCQCNIDADCVEYDDGDLCNGIFFCDNNICAPQPGSEVTCTPDEPLAICTELACNPATGLCDVVDSAEYSPCDDGDACTGCAANDPECGQGDFCQGGFCKAGLGTPCSCSVDDDCLQFEDGDACNGTLACVNNLCEVDVATVVDCSGEPTPNACSTVECTPNTGVCDTIVPLDDGVTCDDGDVCTTGETCTGGVCGGGSDNAACDCTEDADCASLDDGDVCNGGFTCNTGTGKCEADNNVVDCSGQMQDDCNMLACNPSTGACDVVTPVTDGTSCDDSNACTDNDQCTAGVCGGTDTCTACSDDADCDSLDTTPSDVCDGHWTCNTGSGICEETAAVDCSGQMQDTCNMLACNAATGACDVVTPVTDGTSCDDSESCTDSDQCTAGVCGGSDTCPTCTVDGDCTNQECVSGYCRDCDPADNAGCTGNAPICDATATCVACSVDQDCIDAGLGTNCLGNGSCN